MVSEIPWELWCPHDIFHGFRGDGPLPRIGERVTIIPERGEVSFRVTDVEHFPVPDHLRGRCIYGVRVHAEREVERG